MIRTRRRLSAFLAGTGWAAAACIPAAAATAPESARGVNAGLPACQSIPCSLPTSPGRTGWLNLSGIEVAGYQAGEGGPIEVVSFFFGDFEADYTAQTDHGTADSGVQAGYDLKKVDERTAEATTSDPQERGEVVAGASAPVGELAEVEAPSLRIAAKPVIKDISAVKRPDKSTPELLNAPSMRGSLTMVVPAGTCSPGARYPAITLRSGEKVYELHDVRVASCAPAVKKEKKPSRGDKLEYMKVELKEVIVRG